MLWLALLAAIVLRFWQLGNWPPGLYRDEAFNALDALKVLAGQHTIFFTANNGREPLYIYLTALATATLGQTVIAVRITAAIVGSLTTLGVYKLGQSWFGPRTAIFAAWLWAITLWPIHLSRVGFRVILLAPLLTLTLWLATEAYRQQKAKLWLLSGLIYGLAFYSYLAIRFTPLLLLLLALFLWWRNGRSRLWPALLWFALGATIILLPLLNLIAQDPSLALGRTGQVSILNQAVNDGNLWATLWQHTINALALFIYQGDTILRHNPAGRPLFDTFMALPFLIGLVWCLRHWRQPAATALLLWTLVMLGPTILAEDTPHFLRAAGILPGVLLLPAIGLNQWWQWQRLPSWLRYPLPVLLLLLSTATTIIDYVNYSQEPQVAYLFEAAITDLAQKINQEASQTAVFVDQTRYNLPALQFLIPPQRIQPFIPQSGIATQTPPLTIYTWPYQSLDFVPTAIHPPALISAQQGPLARGDLETDAYPFYLRYHAQPRPTNSHFIATFGDEMQLQNATITQNDDLLLIDLYWQTETAVTQNLTVFVHLIQGGKLLAQNDNPPMNGHWPPSWWQPGFLIHDQHLIHLPLTSATNYQIVIGLYDAQTLERLPVFDQNGQRIGDSWQIK